MTIWEKALWELRLAIVACWRAKLQSVIFVATFVVVIAANVVIFAIFRGLVIKPFPLPESESIVITLNHYPKTNFGRVGASIPNYYERSIGIPAFSQVAAVRFAPVVLMGEGSERVDAGFVTASFFRLLQTHASMGRLFLSDGAEKQNDRTVVLSHAFWVRRHGCLIKDGSNFRIPQHTRE